MKTMKVLLLPATLIFHKSIVVQHSEFLLKLIAACSSTVHTECLCYISTETVVTRILRSVTLSVHCLSRPLVSITNVALLTAHVSVRLVERFIVGVHMLICVENERFRGITDISTQCIEAVRSFRKSVNSYQTKRRHIPVCTLCVVTKRTFPCV
jgi:hypothetical protein